MSQGHRQSEDRRSMRERSQHGFTLIELMIAVAILAILVAIAIPNFFRYQGKSRQAEAAYNLGSIFGLETAFMGEFARYGSFSEIGFDVQVKTNRYSYRGPAAGGAAGSSNTAGVDLINAGIGSLTGENTVVPSDASVGAGGGAFTATATADLDSDATVDQWHVNDQQEDLDVPDVNDVLL